MRPAEDGYDPYEDEWPEYVGRARNKCFSGMVDMIKFANRRLPAQGGPWHLALVNCPAADVSGTRTLEGVLSALPKSRVGSWEIEAEEEEDDDEQ